MFLTEAGIFYCFQIKKITNETSQIQSHQSYETSQIQSPQSYLFKMANWHIKHIHAVRCFL